jgi:predicted metalloprotease with PDZ domain
MFRVLVGLCAAICATLSVGASARSAPAQQAYFDMVYRPALTPDSNDFVAMDVSITFVGDSDGVTDVEFPNAWGRFGDLYKYISNISVDGATIEPSKEPNRHVLRHRAGAKLTLSYRVSGAARPDQLREGDNVNDYRPIINPGYFHLLGSVMVARPDHLSNDTPASFRIEGMPQGTSFASDMQHVTADRPLEAGDLIDSVAVGGDFRILDAGKGARLAIRGKIDARDDAGWIKGYRDTAQAITSYWESVAGPYLVTILPFAPANEGSTSIGGTGRSDAYAFFATSNAQPEDIDRIMGHEMGHSWVPRRIGNMKDGPDEPESYWFSEGFTDFTSSRAMVRAGLWTPEKFAVNWNAALAEYERLSVKDKGNVEVAKLFWTNGDAQRLPYLRGMLFASWLDDELRRLKKPTTLRAILLKMQSEAKRLSMAQVEKQGYGIGLLRRFSAKAGLKLDKPMAAYIDAGKPIMFGPHFMTACGRFEERQRAVFHRGFDAEATLANNRIITGVIVNGPAWKAGLRDGMKLVKRSAGEIGNSEVEIAYEVTDNGVAKTLKWMPEGEGQELVRRLLLDPAKMDGCKAYLSN